MTLRQAPDGSAATGQTSANFTVQGFKNGAASALTVSSVTEGATYGPAGNQWRAYAIAIAALPSGAGYDQIHIWPDDTDVLWPDAFTGEVESYDLAAIANLFLSAQGAPAVQSAADSALGDVVDGDAFLSDVLTMPSASLDKFSITDLSAMGITLRAAICASVDGTEYPIDVTIVDGAALEYTIGWETQQHPALTTDESKTWYIDVQVIKDGTPDIILTTGRFSFVQVWQRDSRVS